jgi:hypothetical protein
MPIWLRATLGRQYAELHGSRDCRTHQRGAAAPAEAHYSAKVTAFDRVAGRRLADHQPVPATIPDAEQSRNAILSEAVVRDIIAPAGRQSSEFGLLVEVAAVTGAQKQPACGGRGTRSAGRPGLVMPTSRKVKGKALGAGVDDGPAGDLASPAEAERCIMEELGSYPAVRPRGGKRQIRPGGGVDGLPPHSSIVRQILAGVPIRSSRQPRHLDRGAVGAVRPPPGLCRRNVERTSGFGLLVRFQQCVTFAR